MTLPLVILTAISATGFLVFYRKSFTTKFLHLLIALGAGSMLAISLVHILPEALEKTENAVFAFMAGFLVIYIIEELLTPHRHDHGHEDHTHEDPHEHIDHVALMSFIAVFLHTIFDGFGIRAGMEISETLWYSILVGVIIHQIPVSLSLGAILSGSTMKRSLQMLLMGLFSISAAIGYILSDSVLSHVNGETVALITAFAGGSLLYVATVDLLPIIHGNGKAKTSTLICFLIWCLVVTGIKLIEWDHHGHSHTEHNHTATEALRDNEIQEHGDHEALHDQEHHHD